MVDIAFGGLETLAQAVASAHANDKLHSRVRQAYTLAMQAVAQSKVPPIPSRSEVESEEAERHSRGREAVSHKLYEVRQRE